MSQSERSAMISFLLPAVLISCLGCSPSTAIDPPALPDTGSMDATVTAFVGVNVVPMDRERVLENQTVIVEGDRIVTVGHAGEVEIPDGAIRIDGTGRYLMPGLAEMHGHIPPPNQPREHIEHTLFLYAANGITTVRGMLGAPGQLELRRQAAAGEILGPTLYLAGPSFNGSSVSSPEQAADMVRRQKTEGWDLLKVHPGLTLAEYDAMARTANEVGIRFGGHVPAAVGLEHALEMGQETFDHLDGYVAFLSGAQGPVSTAELAHIVSLTKEAGAWVVPTMVLWETLYCANDLAWLMSFPELKYTSQGQVNSWASAYRGREGSSQCNMATSTSVIDARMRVLSALSDAGARILMGTDAPQQFSIPGFSLHREMARMENAGMTPYEVLASGTAAVGAYFAESDTFGLVQEGHRADLILIRGNPLERLSNVAETEGVMVRGRWIPESEIQDRLEAVQQYYRP